MLRGHVRETPEFGYWLGHCFPITDSSGRVQQLGLFVVNVTAEATTGEILDLPATDPRLLRADPARVLEKFDQSIRHYHSALKLSFKDLACPFTEAPRRADRFRWSIQQLDIEISQMRELIYTMISLFSLPKCFRFQRKIERTRAPDRSTAIDRRFEMRAPSAPWPGAWFRDR